MNGPTGVAPLKTSRNSASVGLKVNYAFDIGGSAAAGVVTVVLTIIVASFALRLFARVFQFEEAQ